MGMSYSNLTIDSIKIMLLEKLAGLNLPVDILLHGYKVGTLSCQIAERLGLDNCYDLTLMGILHDIGKSKIDPKILLKPTKLRKAEFRIMEKHSQYSQELIIHFLGDSTRSRYLAKAVRHHHESWDGTGYPDGSMTLQIPLESRILAIADVFDAMTQPRVYRPYPLINAIEAMKKELDKKSDPELFKVALPVLNKWLLSNKQ